jgi:hypothetical protein
MVIWLSRATGSAATEKSEPPAIIGLRRPYLRPHQTNIAFTEAINIQPGHRGGRTHRQTATTT